VHFAIRDVVEDPAIGADVFDGSRELDPDLRIALR
jgi:hypothetical protein